MEIGGSTSSAQRTKNEEAIAGGSQLQRGLRQGRVEVKPWSRILQIGNLLLFSLLLFFFPRLFVTLKGFD